MVGEWLVGEWTLTTTLTGLGLCLIATVMAFALDAETKGRAKAEEEVYRLKAMLAESAPSQAEGE